MKSLLRVIGFSVALLVASPAVAKTTVCPGSSTVDGNDISYWQGTINWAGVKAAGRKFVIMRAAHAMAVDTKFDFNWKSCHDQGLHCGVYQFFEPNVDPIGQADLMLAKMGKLGPGDLPPVIDVESTGGGMAATAVSAAVKKWIDHVEAKVGRKPMIYSGGYFWEDNVKSTAFVDYPLWHPQYCSNCCPNIANPWKKWYYWQFSSTGKVGGISGNVDMDLWNGNQASLDAWAVQDSTPGCTLKCDGATLVKADCSKVDCAKAESGCVVDDLGGRCVSKYCPAKGDKLVCVPSPKDALLGTCKNGALSTGDCSKYGAFCSTAAAQAKCVSAFCATSPTTKPVAKDVCLPDGKRYACNAAGDISEKPCEAKTVCKDAAGGATCEAVTCDPHCEATTLVSGDCKKLDCATLPEPAKGSCAKDDKGARCISKYCLAAGTAKVCMPDDDAVATCTNGAITVALCLPGEQICAHKAPGGPACADKVCVPSQAMPPLAGATCLPGNTILACSGAGLASLTPCPDGQTCEVGAAIAQCATPKPPDGPDAGSDPDAGSADDTGMGGDPDAVDNSDVTMPGLKDTARNPDLAAQTDDVRVDSGVGGSDGGPAVGLDGTTQPTGTTTGSTSNAGSSSCNARARGQPATVAMWLLLGLALALRRKNEGRTLCSTACRD